jgi:hypothetical protein
MIDQQWLRALSKGSAWAHQTTDVKQACDMWEENGGLNEKP